jgi:hypothetical protein
VQLAGARELLTAVEKAAAVQRRGNTDPWLPLPTKSKVVSKAADTFSNTADLLKSLADIPGVSGHEREVLEAIIAALPQWARKEATIDSQGNLIVQAGPKLETNTVQFIAHMDEVGFEITNIADDGTVSLRTRGGMFQSLWEGQPALLHFDRKVDDTGAKPPLDGVFVLRDTATSNNQRHLPRGLGLMVPP